MNTEDQRSHDYSANQLDAGMELMKALELRLHQVRAKSERTAEWIWRLSTVEMRLIESIEYLDQRRRTDRRKSCSK